MTVNPEIACDVFECLGRMWKSGSFCDFTIIVEDERIQCHRCVLGACSEFFSVLFNSKMKEQAEGCVTIPNITKSTLDIILNSVYAGEDGLTPENVFDVWHASNQLQIRFMIKKCEKLVMGLTDAENYLDIYEQAKLLDSSFVIKFIKSFMMENFENFRGTETFLNLPVDILCSMVESQDLYVSSENLVVEYILKWICFNPQAESESSVCNDDGVDKSDNKKDSSSSENTDTESGNETRKSYLAKLLSAARIYLCSTGFLETLLCNKHICSCPRSLSMVSDALVHNRNAGRHDDCWPSQAIRRLCSSYRAGIICVSLVMQNQQSRSTFAKFFFYSFEYNRRFHICDLDFVDENDFSITVFNNELYCYSSGVFVMSIDRNLSIVNVRYNTFDRTKLLSHGDYIYASTVQQRHNDRCDISLYKLKVNNSKDNKWNLCMVVREQNEDNSLVSCGQYILLFTQNHLATNTSVTCYNPQKEMLRKLDDMEGTPKNVISFCVDKQVYVLQENGSLWKAVKCRNDADMLNLQFVSKHLESLSVHCVAFYRDQLYLFVHTLQGRTDRRLPSSIPGVFDSIKVVEMPSSVTICRPMFAPSLWQPNTYRLI